MTTHQSSEKIQALKDRAHMFAQVRSFFKNRNVLEVDVPCLSPHASVDAHIDLIPSKFAGHTPCYLHSSPEYGMKRLLAMGIGDIYQLSHVFRDGEVSPKHNPEFMVTEWYRLGFILDQLIEETFDFISLFLGNKPTQIISYRQAFLQYVGFDYLEASCDKLHHEIYKLGIDSHLDPKTDSKDDFLNILLAVKVEPNLGKGCLTALNDYPATQCALAKKRRVGDEEVASRFEVYYEGVELANGYHELVDADEQLKRLQEANQQRKLMHKDELPIDMSFIDALHKGLPDCCGVAVGFDRLMMLRQQAQSLQQVIPFAWAEA